ncbi:MAG: hypothetical protein A3B74_01110 [Candidatus Kerfeldbacteria bacterium RIFCSPHIGHO2_02_FULL_42_14]|uniref:Uncharacterized protein n=1 Tax=Candidatus Kerfeldbacteria bacterium RIFCSPHIGHO2_02_FULL_42_14 TaxID=1798540 RepID=A0A1G2AR88_9BACT|nr:MAG: hypothetical protein A3B74_01110 [Candidatus Kerfeldbacteria bacterium RIFCSPHIGHO2_02_FULL_42_14]OGY81950.1 MAG: hypothetical protein A3E60_01195 [Candidatus Kerfeldbacteria bacterium RIFCSPHIGHO2_12_FULL_42_13]OGY83416.1 MAG: hypothetical protein A3I91_02065 [Candidatus Kerfeldbacteria bacterium RIFCSPLOWO2_02_FULL_42_19]OGY85573.1 MAG: hypothetical protein A3G01_03755 [Candidatus Kerfeldbacteria bacterium RIFCSPLOWO2_12_FULL_43_9]
MELLLNTLSSVKVNFNHRKKRRKTLAFEALTGHSVLRKESLPPLFMITISFSQTKAYSATVPL